MGGLAVVAGGRIEGAAFSVGAVQAGEHLKGFAVGGYKVEADDVRGLIIAAIRTRVHWDMTGVAIAGYNHIHGVQRGLTIGLYNRAEELHGIQIGLLNYAGNNKGIWRWMPIVNAHLK